MEITPECYVAEAGWKIWGISRTPTRSGLPGAGPKVSPSPAAWSSTGPLPPLLDRPMRRDVTYHHELSPFLVIIMQCRPIRVKQYITLRRILFDWRVYALVSSSCYPEFSNIEEN